MIKLLAVIVILAIIALIATPLILNVIDDSKKGAFKSTAYGIIEAAELDYAQNVLDGTTSEVLYTYENGEQNASNGKKLNYKGSNPESGSVYVSKEGKTALLIYNGNLCAEKTFDESEIRITNRSKEDCQISETFECGKTFFD